MKYKITVEDLIQDLQLAKEIAIKNEQANQLVTAVMAQAKLLGLDSSTITATDKPTTIELIAPLTPDAAKAISDQLEDEY
jgi:phage terminase small subunit